MENPTAAIIIIGNEILSGRTQDKNISYIGKALAESGIVLREVRVIPDIEQTIIDTVNELRKRFTYIFTTGGIGPTHDDITSASVAKAFGVALYRHPDAEHALRAHYTDGTINEARLKMADVPEGSTLIPNSVSTAPGYNIANVYVMAGVPRIMQAMFDAILPQLTGGKPVESLSVTTNLPEGTIADGLTKIQCDFPQTDIGSYPNYRANGYCTTLVIRSVDKALNYSVAEKIRELIATLGGHEIDEPEAA